MPARWRRTRCGVRSSRTRSLSRPSSTASTPVAGRISRSFRDADGLECDLLYENGNGIGVIETKSGTTIRPGHLSALDRVAKLLPRVCAKAVIHGGTDRRPRGDCEVVPLRGLAALLARLDPSPPVPGSSG